MKVEVIKSCVVVQVKQVTCHANHAERQNGTLSNVDRP